MDDLDLQLRTILNNYKQSFSDKVYNEENNDSDILMSLFKISPKLKRENRQYWGRELGMCWQLLVAKICELKSKDFKPAFKVEGDEPTDLFLGKDAIDTKYRIGSGDSGTLKKFKKYGQMLKDQGYNPIILILREDNLPAAITACKAGGWTIIMGDKSFEYVRNKTGFNLKDYLEELRSGFGINRS